MATEEAVLRRRKHRELARKARQRQVAPAGTWSTSPNGVSLRDHWRERIVRDCNVACRLARRRYPSRGTGFVQMPLIVLDPLYVQALRAGIEMLDRVIWDGASDPRDTTAWRFWCSLHYETRAGFALERREQRWAVGRQVN